VGKAQGTDEWYLQGGGEPDNIYGSYQPYPTQSAPSGYSGYSPPAGQMPSPPIASPQQQMVNMSKANSAQQTQQSPQQQSQQQQTQQGQTQQSPSPQQVIFPTQISGCLATLEFYETWKSLE